jgi:hypothetical protein
MDTETVAIGRVLRASTAAFTAGSARLLGAGAGSTPQFGALVKTVWGDGAPTGRTPVTYGLIYNLAIEDDAFVRQLVAAEVEDEEYIADQRQRRQAPMTLDVLVLGYGDGAAIYQRPPPRPPNALDRVYLCTADEFRLFTAQHDWLRTVLIAADAPADALLAAALRGAAAARPDAQRTAYLVEAGRELAKQLALDLGRLDSLLRQLR